MERHVEIYYTGECPSCGKYQESNKTENVDIKCRNCELTENGKLVYVRNAKGYEDDDSTIEIGIQLKNETIVIRCLTPEISIS